MSRSSIKLISPFALSLTLAATCLLPAHAETQTLANAIDQANQHIAARKSQQSNITAASHEVRQAKAPRRPQFRLSGGATIAEYDNSATRARGFQNGEGAESINAEFVISQQLINFGTNDEIAAAQSDLLQTEQQLNELDRNIQLNVIRAYIDVLRFRALADQAEQNVLDGKKLYGIVSKQVEKGRSAKVDGHIAATQLAATQAQLAQQEGLLHDAEARYQRLIGQNPGALVKPSAPTLPANLAAALQQAQDSHPLLKASNQGIESAQARLQAQEAANKPTVNVELFANTGHDVQAIDGRDDAYGIRVVGNWQIYNGGGNAAATKAAAARLQSASYSAEDTLQSVQETVRQTWQALQANRAQIGFTETQATADEKVFYSYQKLLKAGRETPLNMFVVQRSRDQSRLAFTDLQYRLLLNEYELLLAMGQLAL